MRRVLIGLAAALLALGMAPASAASTPSQMTIRGAEATWYFDAGGVATGVLLRAVQQADHGPASAGGVEGVNVQVTQEYVDPSTGSDIFTMYSSEPYYAPASSLSVDTLKGATVQATVQLYDVSTGAGPFAVDVTAAWTPTGGKTHTLSNVWDTEGGSWMRNRTNQSTIEAMATGSMAGYFPYGALGETDGVLGTGHTFYVFRPPAIASALTGMLDVYAAEGRSTSHINGATSTWVVGGDQNISVNMSVEQDHGASASTAQAWIEVYGSYFDVTTNEDVAFDMNSEVTSVTGASVDPSTQGASLAGTFSVAGYEFRTNAAGDTTTTSIGPFTMTGSATWTATGALTHYRTLFIERGPDLAFKQRYYSRARQAAASGEISGSVVTAALTDVQNAFTYDETRTISTK